MANVTTEQLKSAVKILMKNRNRTYGDLAEVLGLSQVSVKRFMSKEEISLSRLIQICNWLEITLTELEKLALHGRGGKKTYFTDRQEQFLSKNPNYLSFLFHLYADEKPEVIQKKYGLSVKSLNLYLLRLEKIDLIRKTAGEYRPVHREFPSPIPYGILVNSQFKNVLETGTSFFKRYNSRMFVRKSPEADKGSQTVLGVFGMSRDSYLSWFEKYKALYQELVQTSNVEEKMGRIKNKKSIVLMHMHGLVEENDIEMEGIKNMFGRVTELETIK